jgi:hypothetical protein
MIPMSVQSLQHVSRLRALLRYIYSGVLVVVLMLMVGGCDTSTDAPAVRSGSSETGQQTTPTTSPAASPSPKQDAHPVQIPQPAPTTTRRPTNAPKAVAPQPTPKSSPATVPKTQTRPAVRRTFTPDPKPVKLGPEVTAWLDQSARLINKVSGRSEALQAGPDVRVLLNTAVLAFLDSYSLTPRSVAALNEAISQLPPLVYSFPNSGQSVAAADIDGDGEPELIAGYNLFGVHPAWFDLGSDESKAQDFPTRAPEKDFYGMTIVHSSNDLTNDGISDVMLVTTTPGISAFTEVVRVFRWDDGPRRVFDVPVVSWVDPSSWELRTTGGVAEIDTVCAVFGHYDIKHLPSPRLTRTFAWDGTWFSEIKRSISPAVSIHDQINRAEAAFWAGAYEPAVSLYTEAIDRPVASEDQDLPIDWEGLARLRIAQISLLRRTDATSELKQVAQRGGVIGLIGQRMLDSTGTQNTLRPFVELQRLNLKSSPPPGENGQIQFPVDEALVLALGKALELGLQNVPPDQLSRQKIFDVLGNLGFDVRDAIVGDLNGDSTPEAVVSIVRNSERFIGPPVNEFWFLRRSNNRWVAEPAPVLGDAAITNGMRQISSNRSVFVLIEPGAGSERSIYLSFDSRHIHTWLSQPTLADMEPANPFDSPQTNRCRHNTAES